MEKICCAANKRIVHDGVWRQNPISRQTLGICSALAVTVQMRTALAMGLVLIFVTAMTSYLISRLKDKIPSRIRLIVELTLIASLVIVADQVLKAFAYDISKQLSVFVGLVITNCIILGRAEGYALSHAPFRSLLDGAANGAGYALMLMAVAFFRELLGSGTCFGWPLVPQVAYRLGYENCGFFLIAPGAFFLLGVMIWIHRAMLERPSDSGGKVSTRKGEA